MRNSKNEIRDTLTLIVIIANFLLIVSLTAQFKTSLHAFSGAECFQLVISQSKCGSFCLLKILKLMESIPKIIEQLNFCFYSCREFLDHLRAFIKFLDIFTIWNLVAKNESENRLLPVMN